MRRPRSLPGTWDRWPRRKTRSGRERSAEQAQQRLALLVRDRERLRRELLPGLQAREPGALLRKIRVDQRAKTLLDRVVQLRGEALQPFHLPEIRAEVGKPRAHQVDGALDSRDRGGAAGHDARRRTRHRRGHPRYVATDDELTVVVQ